GVLVSAAGWGLSPHHELRSDLGLFVLRRRQGQVRSQAGRCGEGSSSLTGLPQLTEPYRYPGTFVRHVFLPTREVVCAKGFFHSDSCWSLRSSSRAPSLRLRHLRMSLTWRPRLRSSGHHRSARTCAGRLFFRAFSPPARRLPSAPRPWRGPSPAAFAPSPSMSSS